MKEAFWGVLIIILGLFGIVVVNIFQNVTVDNDRVYYLIKESTEAAAYDALDLTYYRLSGDLRIVEDKFVENLTRRFAENVSMGDYTIYVEDVNEMPPKVSVRIRSGITSIQGDQFGIVNEVDGIIETKYNLNEVLDFLGIEEKDWNSNRNNTNSIGDVCNLGGLTQEDLECIPGDIMFTGFGEVFNIKNAVCDDETDKLPKNVERAANYKTCNCDGKWEEGSETIIANPVRNGSNYDYTWNFYKKGELRTIDEKITKKVKVQVCTTGIGIMVPKKIEEVNQNTLNTNGNKIKLPYEPSTTDNNEYMMCPEGGIRIPIGMSFVAHPNYIPKESANRDLKWSVADSSVLSVTGSNPSKSCTLNKESGNCLSKGTITTKALGTTTIKIETLSIDGKELRGQSATCKVEVFDGTLDSIGCEDMFLQVGGTKDIIYINKMVPKNATKFELEYSLSNNGVGKISGNKITGIKSGTETITIKDKVTGKSGTCKLTVASKASGSSGDGGGGYWIAKNVRTGEYKAYTSYDAMIKDIASNMGYANTYQVNSDGSSSKSANVTCNNGPNCHRVYPDGTSDTTKNPTYTPPPPPTPSYGGAPISSVVNPSAGVSQAPMYCFLKGTKVAVKEGYKNIDKIEVGDNVLSFNVETGKNEYKRVTKIFYHPKQNDVLYSMIVDSKLIKASSAHKFYIKTDDGFEWISAKDLKIGDIVVDSNGRYLPITNIISKPIIEDLYNIEVEGNHNYYVTKAEILVHNRK